MAEIRSCGCCETRDVPPGWVGKNNAVWLGAPKREERVAAVYGRRRGAGARKQSRARCKSRGKRVPALVSFSPEQVTRDLVREDR